MTRPFAAGASAPAPRADGPEVAERPAWQRALTGLAWVATLIAVIVLLGRLGSGALSTPPLLDRGALRRWLDGRDAVTVAFALIRLVGLGLAWYLLVVTVLGLAARASRVPALVRIADLATVPAVRKALGAIAGIGLTASAASLMAADLLPGPSPAAEAPAARTHVVLERLPDGSDVILRRLPDADDGTSTMRVEAPAEAPAPQQWTAAPGDHLWHVAEATLAEAWGRPPSDAEVAPYWQAVIEANRGALADPAQPDLIFPGQVFRLPPPPAAPPPVGAPPPAS